ncbi:MAG TPA: NUDIX domain-containing protein [Acidimicrobiales bacterium]|nr:NUDIX domain-containing protein [Acidimicrobiales bacterium]
MKQPLNLRNAVRVAAVLRRIVWFILRPRTIGAQIIVLDDRGGVLLVRHSYDRAALRLPGGGVKRSETFAECAARELREETSLVVDDPAKLELLGVYTGREGNQAAFLAAFIAPAGSWTGTPGGSAEIDSAEFHLAEQLPEDTSKATRARVTEAVAGLRGLSGRW